MRIGKVIGSVVSVSKIDELRPVRIFIVQDLDSDFKLKDSYIYAIDTVGAGFGDVVLVTKGSGSRMTKISGPTHNDASIVARVDDLKIGEK